MPPRLSRRGFLASSAALAGFPHIVRADKKKPPASERLTVGVVGVAGQGGYDLREVAKAGAEIVALCDVVENRAEAARKEFPKANYFTDFRKMLDMKGIDAVVVATPDHTHAVATMAALKSGRHVYCEKPLTHTVHEARQVIKTAKKLNRVTQMGTQIHALPNYRRVVEKIQTGAIGPVREVHAWSDKIWDHRERPKDKPPIPKGLHWDLWVGPAPMRPYSPLYVPFYWRNWWDFGGGVLNDMACHYMDLPFWGLKLRHPTMVRAEGVSPDPQLAPEQLKVHYEFPARKDMPAVKLTWYNGGLRPELFAAGKLPKWGDGVLFVGDKGMLLSGYTQHKLLPENEFEGYVAPKPFIPDSIGHHKEWVEACKHGSTTTCNFDYSGTLTETVLLGTVAYRSGKTLHWDAKKFTTGDAEADRWLHKEYREGWSL
jgi:predicted dehydrogenase